MAAGGAIFFLSSLQDLIGGTCEWRSLFVWRRTRCWLFSTRPRLVVVVVGGVHACTRGGLVRLLSAFDRVFGFRSEVAYETENHVQQLPLV